MEVKGMEERERFAYLSGLILRRSRGLSYRLLSITVVTCLAATWVATMADAPRWLQYAMAANTLLMVWASRRAVTEIDRNRTILKDDRLTGERRTVISMMTADWAALCVATITAAYLFHAAIAGPAA